MDLALDDTIAALASAPGPSRRGIIRISGDDVRQALSGWFQPDDEETFRAPRLAGIHAGSLIRVGSRAPIRASAYFWPDRRSYTGQPLVELHLPGSPPLLETVLASLYRRGVRAARPGEFTMRAFLAGKLDLLQAEAVLGVIDAHDHVELQTALSQLAGGLSGRLAELRHDLLELLADLEAGLDFIEEDIEFVSRIEVSGRIALSRRHVDALLEQAATRIQSRTRPRVVLAGLPNAGKSTLFNRIAGQAAALVSATEGTTRDFLQVAVNWSGLEFDLVDTAGWEVTTDGIASAAQQHRLEQVRTADLVVWCSSAGLILSRREMDSTLFNDARSQARNCIRIQTQTDRSDAQFWLFDPLTSPLEVELASEMPLEVSAVSGSGLSDLEYTIRKRLTAASGTAPQWLGMTTARCRGSLESTSDALHRAEAAAGNATVGDELIAVDIRDALDHLGQILGVIYTDDILDRVFSKFCIGK